jgi:acyl carrier protein
MADMLTDQAILEGIREELLEIRVPDAETAELDSTWGDLDVDSLDLVEIVKALEDRYEIGIPDARLKDVASVRDAVALVKELAMEGEGVSA